MSHEDFYGAVNFSVSAGLVPWHDPSEYVYAVTGKIIAYSEADAEMEVGEIVLRVVLATEATNQGEDLFEVCDADSAILEGIYAALFDQSGEIKEEFDIEPGWNSLVFLEKVEIDPPHCQTTLNIQAIETALALFASEGLVVAVEEGLNLTIEAWKRLGFVRIGGTRFVFRDQLKVNPYRDEKSV